MLAEHDDTNSLAAVANGRSSTATGRAWAIGPLRSPIALRTVGVAGLVGVPAAVLGVVGGAASAPTQYVPARSGGWPDWLSGPLHPLGLTIGSSSFQWLTLLMCASYAA